MQVQYLIEEPLTVGCRILNELLHRLVFMSHGPLYRFTGPNAFYSAGN